MLIRPFEFETYLEAVREQYEEASEKVKTDPHWYMIFDYLRGQLRILEMIDEGKLVVNKKGGRKK